MSHPVATLSRRRFLAATGATALSAAISADAASLAAHFDVKGLQLEWLSPELKKDFAGTLRKLAAMGYRDVELLSDFGRSPRQLIQDLKAAGLRCESRLYWLRPEARKLEDFIAEHIEFAQAMELRYLVYMKPLPLDDVELRVLFSDQSKLAGAIDKIRLDDFKRQAELFNKIGAQTQRAGIQFAYHNFNIEFLRFGGTTGFDELLHSTDPDLVKIEMDCGWVTAGGADPAAYLRKYPGRFPLLHIKDVKDRDPNTALRLKPVEVGHGIVDWTQVLAAARASGAKGGYVEFEPPPPYERPLLESAKLCFDFLHA